MAPKPSLRQLPSYDAIVIGGGLYGSQIAMTLSKKFKRIALIEKSGNLFTAASFNNSARIHHGYHYPRHFPTAKSSSKNYTRFINDFPECVDDSYHALYAIAKTKSKISTVAFQNLCSTIRAPLKEASAAHSKLFNPRHIDAVFSVEEAVFDANKLRGVFEQRLAIANVDILYHADVEKVLQTGKDVLGVHLFDGRILTAQHVFNCTYAHINSILFRSHLPIIPLKYELAEQALFQLPQQLRELSITVIDGSFFSAMPFPPIGGVHTLSHVTHTPHRAWYDYPNAYNAQTLEKKTPTRSNFRRMQKHAISYVPSISDALYRGSLFETKTMLPSNETDDGRPILFKPDYHLKNFTVVLGAKIDNVYDVVELIEHTMLSDEPMKKKSTHHNVVHTSNFDFIDPEITVKKSAVRR